VQHTVSIAHMLYAGNCVLFCQCTIVQTDCCANCAINISVFVVHGNGLSVLVVQYSNSTDIEDHLCILPHLQLPLQACVFFKAT
jgi:hypothetical protein